MTTLRLPLGIAASVLAIAAAAHPAPSDAATPAPRAAACESDSSALRLWTAARASLEQAALAQERRRVDMTIDEFERDVDARTGAVLAEQRSRRSGVSANPYASRPVEELSERGWVQERGGGYVYYAPSPRVLASQRFLDDHCVRIAKGASPAHVALAFEPRRGGGAPGIRGTLVVSEAGEPARVDFAYTGLPRSRLREEFGGRVEFARLPGGTWSVRRWILRAPVLAVVERTRLANSQLDAAGGMRFLPLTDVEVQGVKELGGEVVEAREAAAR